MRSPLFRLVVCVTLACGGWYLWTIAGIGWAHRLVVAEITKDLKHAVPKLSELNESGEAFGGGNALFAAIAGGLVLWAGWLQATALSEARSAYQRQQFEGVFFELLKLSRELLERFEVPTIRWFLAGDSSHELPKVGIAALDSIASSINSRVQRPAQESDPKTATPRPQPPRPTPTPTDTARSLVREYQRFYEGKSSSFGPYLRVLYQTFRHIEDSLLEPQEKRRFAKIARGQISEGAVFLIALNGLTSKGHGFIRYIQRFGLLEHMNTEYRISYQDALAVGYHDCAFGEGAEKNLEPKQVKTYFESSSRV